MIFREVTTLLVPACKNLGFMNKQGLVSMAHAEYLDKVLGINVYRDFVANSGTREGEPLSEELVQLFKSLAGPHGRTILRAYQIKHDIKVPENCP